jgi:hypothetical protein
MMRRPASACELGMMYSVCWGLYQREIDDGTMYEHVQRQYHVYTRLNLHHRRDRGERRRRGVRRRRECPEGRW